MKHWPQMRLGDLTDVLSGFAFDSEGFGDSGEMPVVRIRDVVPGSSSTFYRGTFDPRYIVSNGDILIGMDGEFNRARWRGGKALLNQRVSRIAPSCPELDDGYLFYFLPAALKAIEQVTPFVTVKHLSTKQIRDIAVPLPPLPEQQRIAEILDKADALRAKRRAALAELDTLTQSIFLDMFGDPATNTKKWPVLDVGKVAEVQGGLQVTSSRKSLPREVPYLRVANVYRGLLDLREIKQIRASEAEVARTSLQKNDLLIVEGHGNPAEIGRGALWDGSIPTCVHQNHLIRARFAVSTVHPLFACAYLNSAGGRRHLLRAGKTTSGLNTISVSEVRSTPISIPPISVQHEFAKLIVKLQELMRKQRLALAKIDVLLATLQHRAFRGELWL